MIVCASETQPCKTFNQKNIFFISSERKPVRYNGFILLCDTDVFRVHSSSIGLDQECYDFNMEGKAKLYLFQTAQIKNKHSMLRMQIHYKTRETV